MENNKNKKSVKFQGDMLKFCDFIQVFVFTRNHHLKTGDHLIQVYLLYILIQGTQKTLLRTGDPLTEVTT